MVIFLFLVMALLFGFVTPLVIAAVLAAIGAPLYEHIVKIFRGRRNLAALTVVLATIVFIVLPFIFLMNSLLNEAGVLFAKTRDELNTEQVASFLQSNNVVARGIRAVIGEKNFDADTFLQAYIVPAAKNIGLYISHQIGNILSNILNFFFKFFIMAVTLFYLLRDGRALGKFLLALSPLKTSDEIHIFETFKSAGKAVFIGNLVSALSQGVIGGLGFLMFGVGSPVLWGTVMGFLALIPLLGPYLIFLPATIYMIAVGKPIALILGFLLYNILITSTVDNFIKPKLIGSKINVHPLLVLLSILGGLKLFGILGILYGPLIVVIFLALVDMGANRHWHNGVK
ncbi:MAG: protein of unknown function UPF0118 [Candidatus Magasanikbacteria bacterium]|nr:protein of unknown function UPF0118 [Candidatus Magasanikbacteria bacterium]